MPRIDWRDDEDLPRWERLYHPRRQRFARLTAATREGAPLTAAARAQGAGAWILNLTREARDSANAPARRPLHLIWGEPTRSAPSQ